MKKFRRIMALLLATIMVLSMGTVAFAAKDTKHTITVNNEDQVGNHTYEAYQVFKGDYDTESKTLSNIEWGNGVDSAAVLAAVKADTATFGADAAKAETASDVAALLGTGKDTAVAKKFAAIVGDHLGTAAGTSTDGVIDVTGDGYYFVKDKAGTVPTDDDNKDPLVGDSETRYILKVVEDTTVTAKSGTVESKKKVDDVNDSTGEGSELKDSADYDIGDDIPYTLTFKLPANYADYATYKVAFIDDMSVGLTYNDDAKIYYGASDKTGTAIAFSVDSEATSEYAGGKVYKATIADLKTAAPDLKAGDEITIKYTAKLNAGAVLGSAGNPNKYQVEYSNNPNGNGESTGKTPWDKNIVFTYKTVFNKVDGEKKALTGADFKLEKKVGNDWVDVTKLNGEGKINPTKTGDTTGSTFEFAGLDDGDYRLTETVTPKGYNDIDPIEFTITAEHELESDNPALTALTGTDGKEFTMTANVNAGSLSADIINEKGSTLPETGGIGTTMFYIIGAIMVIGAGVVLISRRRMNVQ